MASLNSSVVFWCEEEITPRSMLLTSSGAVGDRLLFWQSAGSPPLSASVCNSEFLRMKRDPSTLGQNASDLQSVQFLSGSQNPRRGVSCPGNVPSGGNLTPHSFIGVGTVPTVANVVPTPVAEASLAATAAGVPGASQTSATTVGGTGGSGSSSTSPEMVVEDVPISSLLSLLHPATNELQHRIYVKLGPRVFVGMAFNLTKAVLETQGVAVAVTTQSTAPSSASSPLISRRGSLPTTTRATTTTVGGNTVDSQLPMDFASVISFLRLKSPLPPPPKREHNHSPQITSSKGLFGGAGCKPGAKTINQSVSSFAVVFVLNEAAPPSVQSHYMELARLVGSQVRHSELYWQNLSRERENISAILDRYAGILCGVDAQPDTTVASANAVNPCTVVGSGTTEVVTEPGSLTSNISPQNRGVVEMQDEVEEATAKSKHEPPVGSLWSSRDPWHVYAHVAKRSPLCSELSQILNQVTTTGQVNVMIYGKYSVFFSLPFRAYALMPPGLQLTVGALGKPSLPAVRPGAVWRAMQCLRPYHTLLTVSSRSLLLHQCSRAFPSDTNQSLESFLDDLSLVNSLAKMPTRGHSQEESLRAALWMVYHGHAIIIHPISMRNVYLLSSLSQYWLQPQVLLQFSAQFPTLNLAEVLSSFSQCYTLEEHFYGESRAAFWGQTSPSDRVELVAWLLRHRLIVQVHTYVFSVLSNGKRVEELDEATEEAFAGIHGACKGQLLRTALTTEAGRKKVLSYYTSAIRSEPAAMYLFLRIMTHLPAHLEELMFVESVDRQSLQTCMQLFTSFLVTLRLPDPVAACFAGVEWSN